MSGRERALPAGAAAPGVSRRKCLLSAPALALPLLIPQQAWAGGQIEEPLADAVRGALSSAIANSAPPVPVFSSTEARLRYLRKRWTDRLSQLPGVRTLTPTDPKHACGIGLLQVDGIEPGKLVGDMWNDRRILTTPIITEGEYAGIRVTPNIYSTLEELDQFCDYVEEKVRARG